MTSLPSPDLMYRALIERDTAFDGAFFAGITTTGIFCRPGCGAKKPRREHVEFFPHASDALHAGYRPCLRCRPLAPTLATPDWVARALDLAERTTDRRLTATDLTRAGVHPARAARWFKTHWGMTFQAYHRARRVGLALKSLRQGADVGRAADQGGYQSESGLRDALHALVGTAPTGARAQTELRARWLPTPLGPMLAVADEHGVCLLEFVDRRALASQLQVLLRRVPGLLVPGTNTHLDQLAGELARWFAGTRRDFGVALLVRGTPFQERVWQELRRIPYGTTRSYAAIARALGQPRAVRAVARANGDNRLALLIPCHRVVGSDGALTGYAGKLWRKEWLLQHEREHGQPVGVSQPCDGAGQSR